MRRVLRGFIVERLQNPSFLSTIMIWAVYAYAFHEEFTMSHLSSVRHDNFSVRSASLMLRWVLLILITAEMNSKDLIAEA